MDKQTVITLLKQRQPQLTEFGITSLCLFGSMARGDANAESDIDILIDYEPNTKLSLLDIVHIENELQTVFSRPVQLVSKKGLRPEMLARVRSEQIRVF